MSKFTRSRSTSDYASYFMVDMKSVRASYAKGLVDKEAKDESGSEDTSFMSLKSALSLLGSTAGKTASGSRIAKIAHIFGFLFRSILKYLVVPIGAFLATPAGWATLLVLSSIGASIYGLYVFLRTDKDEGFLDFIDRKLGDLRLPTLQDGKRYTGPTVGSMPIPEGVPAVLQQSDESTKINLGALIQFTKIKTKKLGSYINEASTLSGVPAPILSAFAYVESRFGENLQNTTSRAKGVMQILPSTFKGLVAKYGTRLGIDNGDIEDPRASMIMGAFYIRELLDAYMRVLGGKPNSADLYMLYLLGPSQGLAFLRELKTGGRALATSVISKAAADANRGLFYEGGRPRTIEEVYGSLNGKILSVQRAFEKVEQVGSVNAVLAQADEAPKITGTNKVNTTPVKLPAPSVNTPPTVKRVDLLPAKTKVKESKKASSNQNSTEGPITFYKDSSNRVYAF